MPRAKRSSAGRRRPKSTTGRSGRRRWSGDVTRHSHALALEPKVFQGASPRRIAASLKRSAEGSRGRKGTPYQSAMSMLNFYINRAGRTLPERRKRVLEQAKEELRKVFGRAEEPDGRRRPSAAAGRSTGPAPAAHRRAGRPPAEP